MGIALARRTGGNFGNPKLDLGGCVLYLPLWRQDDAGSSYVYSKDATRYTGTITDTVTWGTQGRDFDGDSGYINLGSTFASAVTSDTTGTIIIWIEPDSVVGERMIFSLNKSDAGNPIAFFRTNNQTLSFYLRNDGGGVLHNAYTGNILSANTWHHCAVTENGTSLTFYLNGTSQSFTEDGNDATAWFNDFTINDVNIGCFDDIDDAGPESFFNGTIGDLFYYSRALSASEIAKNYQATKWRYK